MTAAYRLKGLGWFAGCVAIVLGFYLVSLQVASERNKLDALNARIRSAERDIRALETEFDTRANLAQLEKWNGDILALSAPTAGQFVADEAQLAAVSFNPVAPGGAEVKTAALVVPSLPVFEAAPAPDASAGSAQSVPAAKPAAVQTAAVAVRPKPAAPAVASAAVASVARKSTPAARPVPVRTQRVAMLDDSLLSDLGSRARTEAGRR